MSYSSRSGVHALMTLSQCIYPMLPLLKGEYNFQQSNLSTPIRIKKSTIVHESMVRIDLAWFLKVIWKDQISPGDRAVFLFKVNHQNVDEGIIPASGLNEDYLLPCLWIRLSVTCYFSKMQLHFGLLPLLFPPHH